MPKLIITTATDRGVVEGKGTRRSEGVVGEKGDMINSRAGSWEGDS
jgi:hypothetical protein